jgi:hypothetical protein
MGMERYVIKHDNLTDKSCIAATGGLSIKLLQYEMCK